MSSSNLDLDLGYLVSGVVKVSPEGDFILLYEDEDGVHEFDIKSALTKYVGQEVRLTLASIEMINRMAAIVESGQG